MRLPAFSLVLVGLLALTGCESGSSTSYPAPQTLARTGGAEFDILARGRKVYTTTCTECHVARPVVNLTVEHWRRVIGVMAPRAGLSLADRAALETYLIAARNSLAPVRSASE